MLSDIIKKFFKNELKGLQQIWFFKPYDKIKESAKNYKDEELSNNNHPAHYKIANEISEAANVHPANIILTADRNSYNGGANYKTNVVSIDRGNLQRDKSYVGTYAHEIGHLKYKKLHSHLSFGYGEIPYNLLFFATTNMYAFGLSAYTFMGNNKVLDGANWLFNHSGKYLIGAIIANAVFTRTKEHMADLFAYNKTGVIPSECTEKRHGVIANLLGLYSGIYSTLASGYPTTIERDLFVKIVGKKPTGVSFVEKLKSEREKLKEKTTTTVDI